MTDILMIKIESLNGQPFNINLFDVMAVEFPTPGPITQATITTDEKIYLRGGRVFSVPGGTWNQALLDLEAEYSMGQRVAANHLYIKT